MSFNELLQRFSSKKEIPFKPGKVRLISNSDEFRRAFNRFESYYEGPGWTKAKHDRRGELCTIHLVNEQNRTLLVYFEDETSEVVPVEAIDEQVETFDEQAALRYSGFIQMRRLQERFESEADIDAFDMAALEPNIPARLFCGNKARATICGLIQVFVPILVGISIVYNIVYDNGTTVPNFNGLCMMRQGWDDVVTKLLNKILGMLLLAYMNSFIESRRLLWLEKPTTILMIKEARVFSFMRSPNWCVAGMALNIFSLSVCGIVSVIVIYRSDSPLDIVLNSLALFFVLDIDDLLVDKTDFTLGKYLMGRVKEQCKDHEDVYPSIPYKFRWVLIANEVLLAITQLCVLIAPVYIGICK